MVSSKIHVVIRSLFPSDYIIDIIDLFARNCLSGFIGQWALKRLLNHDSDNIITSNNHVIIMVIIHQHHSQDYIHQQQQQQRH